MASGAGISEKRSCHVMIEDVHENDGVKDSEFTAKPAQTLQMYASVRVLQLPCTTLVLPLFD